MMQNVPDTMNMSHQKIISLNITIIIIRVRAAMNVHAEHHRPTINMTFRAIIGENFKLFYINVKFYFLKNFKLEFLR
jgi:hypothetical protein